MSVETIVLLIEDYMNCGKPIGPKSKLEELDVDSLNLAEITGMLKEHFGIHLEHGDITAASSIADIAALVKKRQG